MIGAEEERRSHRKEQRRTVTNLRKEPKLTLSGGRLWGSTCPLCLCNTLATKAATREAGARGVEAKDAKVSY